MIQHPIHLPGYPKIHNLGHKDIQELFNDEVTIEEKIDGSQFSCGVFDGVLRCRSHEAQLDPENNTNKMFNLAISSVKEHLPKFVDRYIYRFEYLQKPKHNALAYDRTPTDNLILFDVSTEQPNLHLGYEFKAEAAKSIGYEVVPMLYRGYVSGPDILKDLVDRVSVLGGQKIEGVVIKNYNRLMPDNSPMMGKFVSDAYREVRISKSTKEGVSIFDRIGEQLRTEARWNKAVQHLLERGELCNSLEDIGPILRELNRDIEAECADEIKDQLYKWARKDILHRAIRGVPEWYRSKLVATQWK